MEVLQVDPVPVQGATGSLDDREALALRAAGHDVHLLLALRVPLSGSGCSGRYGSMPA